MNKLYTLAVAGDSSSSWLKPLACSNEVSKLKAIVFTSGLLGTLTVKIIDHFIPTVRRICNEENILSFSPQITKYKNTSYTWLVW